jgi:iron(III) transport system permease protein
MNWFRSIGQRYFYDGAASGWLLAAGIVAALVAAPVVSLVVIASRGSGDLWPHLVANVFPSALMQTAVLLAGVGLVVTALGTGLAWLLTAFDFPGRRIFEWALLLPLAIPTYIMAFAYLDILHPLGPLQTALRGLLGLSSPRDLWFPEVRSMAGCILLFGFVLYPYVFLSTRAMFLMQGASLIEVSRTLGASRAGVFFSVALPLARPAIAVGTALALMEALNDIGASEFLGVQTLSVSIYVTWINRSNLPGAAQIAIMLLAIVIGLIALERWARGHQRYAGATQKARRAAPQVLQGWQAAAAVVMASVPVLFGFLLPASYLVVEAARRIMIAGISEQLRQEIVNTITIAALATGVAVALGLTVAYAGRLARGRAAQVVVPAASLGYAVPGTVLAIGLLWPLAMLDNSIAAIVERFLGFSPGLVITGSGLALVYAYSVRFLAISAGGIEAGFGKISPSLDQAARTLGSAPTGTLMRVHLPLLRPAVGAAALLVFVDSMKELPATLLLRPFNFETLATHLYSEAVRGTYEDGSIAALCIVLFGLIPVIMLARLSRRPSMAFETQSGRASEATASGLPGGSELEPALSDRAGSRFGSRFGSGAGSGR